MKRQPQQRAALVVIDLPEHTPEALLSDKGHDADALRTGLAQRKIEVVSRSIEPLRYDRERPNAI